MSGGAVWLLAVGWVNPLALGGLGLVALPIIIHLLSRRQFRRLPWGAMLFLLQAERENRRRTRFEQWLLLALRCIAMALLASLIARPFVQPGAIAALLGSGGGTQRIVLIDDSASLGYREGGRTDFDRVREAAERLAHWLTEGAVGDRLTVYRTSGVREPLHESTLGTALLADVQTAVRKLRVVDAPAHPERVLATIANTLIDADSATRADLYILSDFQRTDWLRGETESDSPLAALRGLDAGAVRVVFVAAREGSRDNAAVVNVEPERRNTIAGFPAVFRARVANYSMVAARDLGLQIDLDGAPLPTRELDDLDPGAEQIVPFEITVPDAGFSRLVVSLTRGDGLTLDDSFRVTLRASDALRLLLVDGQPATDPSQDEVYFLQNALAPPGPASSGLRLEVVDPEALETLALSDFDCVLLCNAPPPSEAAAELLRRYVRRGGGLAIFLGDQAGDGAEYTRVLFDESDGLLPARIDGRRVAAGPDEYVGLIREATHPVTSAFGADDALSEYVRFRRHLRLRSAAAPVESAISDDDSDARAAGAVVLARFSNQAGSLAIVEKPVGQGRVLLFAFPPDLDWHNWPRAVDGSFVVTMLETVQYLARRDLNPMNYATGDRLEVRIDADRFEPRGAFKPPDYPDQPTVAATVDDVSGDVDAPLVLIGPTAERVGVYELELAPREGVATTAPLSVNLPRRESQLAAATAGELAAAIGDLPHEYVSADGSFAAMSDESKHELWPALLGALLFVLMAEQACAWWFGRLGGERSRRTGQRRVRGVAT